MVRFHKIQVLKVMSETREMGSKWFPKKAIENKDWNVITELCINTLSYIRNNK